MDLDIMLQILEKGGLPLGIICASFWYINKKDTFFAKQLADWQIKDDKEDDRLVHLIEKQNAVMAEQTAAVKDLLEWVKSNTIQTRR